MKTTAQRLTCFCDLSKINFQENDKVDDLIAALLNKKSIGIRESAKERLKSQTEEILRRSARSSTFNNKDLIEFCRNLAAYLLAFNDHNIDSNKYEKYNTVFFRLIELLKLLAPSSRAELYNLTAGKTPDFCTLVKLSYSWKDIQSPFIPDKFTKNLLSGTDIKQGLPLTIEKNIETTIEIPVEKVITKIVQGETPVAPKQQSGFGEEDQYKEFKYSFFTNSYNDKAQYINVCREICAFLNTEGGKLLIGVNDNGYLADGVKEDMRYMNWRLDNIDLYCREVKKKIHQVFQRDNDIKKFIDKVHVSPVKGHEHVIEIEVPRATCVIYLDGLAWQRSGSECKKMTSEQIEDRQNELNSRIKEFQIVLKKAIKNKKQVILHAYRSSNSKTISDRYVEPIKFENNGQAIICYDNGKQDIRQFLLSRTNDMELLESDWINEEKHINAPVDLFGWTDHGETYHISLDLRLPEYNYLIESCPKAKKAKAISKLPDKDNVWRLDTTVFSLYPVLRFYLLFADDIEINETEDSQKLKGTIRDYVTNSVLPKLST